MKKVQCCLIRLFICITIGWLFGCFIEDKISVMNWHAPGILFSIMFIPFSYDSVKHRPVIRWIAGGLFFSLPILTMLYMILYCNNWEANPLLWNNFERLAFATIAGGLFIFGGKHVWNYWWTIWVQPVFLFFCG